MKLKIPEIDIVVVNFYPFKKYILSKNSNKVIEKIDIGGPSIIRASSKNFENITPIIDIKDYKKLIENLKKNKGTTDIRFREKMACKVYSETSKYDKIISDWFYEKKINKK